MKRFLFLLIVFTIWINSFGQICDSLSSWNYLQVMIPTCLKSTECTGKIYTNHHYYFHGDSIIGNNNYKVLFENSISSDVQHGNKLGFLREDESRKRIYFSSAKNNSDNTEILLYDFSIKKDSVFKISAFSSTVIALDSIIFLEKKRLVITFSYTDYNYSSDRNDTLKWIEGIGSNLDLLNYYDYPNYLLCFHSNSGLQYNNIDGFNCEYRGPTQSINEIPKKILKIYPNSTYDELYIEKESIMKKIEIFNIYGEKLFTYYPKVTEYKINTQSLREGIYIVKIDNESRKVIIK